MKYAPVCSAFVSEWSDFVSQDTALWRNLYLSWLSNYSNRMLLLSYKKLQDDFFNELFKLSEFLNITLTYKSLWCAFESKEGRFHRRSRTNKSVVYTQSMIDNITRTINEVEAKLTQRFGEEAHGVF